MCGLIKNMEFDEQACFQELEEFLNFHRENVFLGGDLLEEFDQLAPLPSPPEAHPVYMEIDGQQQQYGDFSNSYCLTSLAPVQLTSIAALDVMSAPEDVVAMQLAPMLAPVDDVEMSAPADDVEMSVLATDVAMQLAPISAPVDDVVMQLADNNNDTVSNELLSDQQQQQQMLVNIAQRLFDFEKQQQRSIDVQERLLENDLALSEDSGILGEKDEEEDLDSTFSIPSDFDPEITLTADEGELSDDKNVSFFLSFLNNILQFFN